MKTDLLAAVDFCLISCTAIYNWHECSIHVHHTFFITLFLGSKPIFLLAIQTVFYQESNALVVYAALTPTRIWLRMGLRMQYATNLQ